MLIEAFLLLCLGFLFLILGKRYSDKWFYWAAIISFIFSFIYVVEDYVIREYVEFLENYVEYVRDN